VYFAGKFAGKLILKIISSVIGSVQVYRTLSFMSNPRYLIPLDIHRQTPLFRGEINAGSSGQNYPLKILILLHIIINI